MDTTQDHVFWIIWFGQETLAAVNQCLSSDHNL